MIAVRFKVGIAPYQANELAGFPEAEARRLIQAGVAEEYVVKKAQEKPQADKMISTALNKAEPHPKTRRK